MRQYRAEEMDPVNAIGAQIRDVLEDLIEQGRNVWSDRQATLPEAFSFLTEFHNRLEESLIYAEAPPEVNRQIIAAAFATATVAWCRPINFLPRMPEWLERKVIDQRIYKTAYELAYSMLENFEPSRK